MILTDLIELQELSSKREKASVLDSLASYNSELLNIIFDKDVRFFVNMKKLKPLINDLKSETMPIPFIDHLVANNELLNLLKLLASEEIRGDVSISKCIGYAKNYLQPDELDMFTNILENKTRLGIGGTDINKYCKQFSIDQYEVMYAKPYKKAKVYWDREYYIQPKIDGNRIIDEKFDGPQVFKSRKGKIQTSLKVIEEEMKRFAGFWVADGEVENGSLEETGSIRRQNETAENAIYTIFGFYDTSEWGSKNHTEKYSSTYKIAKEMFKFAEDKYGEFKHVRLIPNYIIKAKTEEEFYELVDKYYNEFLELGYEGAVLKLADHVYTPSAGTKRTDAWVKIKPEESTEGTVVDIVESEAPNRGRIKHFVVRWVDRECKVSPGKFPHNVQSNILKNPNDCIGRKLEFKYQCLSKYGEPRHAGAVKFRSEYDV